MLKIKMQKEVNQRHGERIAEVIQSSVLKDKPNNWIATESDYYRDRVYIYNETLKKEFSIAFRDSKTGYNFFVHERKAIDDKTYQDLIKDRPELKAYDRESLASVQEVATGFKRRFVPVRENAFKAFLEKSKIDIKNEKVFLSLGVSSSNMVFNAIVQVMPWSERVIIIKKISSSAFDKIFDGLCNLNKTGLAEDLNQTVYSARIVVDGEINHFLDDVEDVYNEMGYQIGYTTVEPPTNDK